MAAFNRWPFLQSRGRRPGFFRHLFLPHHRRPNNASCGHRVMRAAPAAAEKWLHAAEDECGAGDPLRGVRTAQEGALRRGALLGLRHTHIHHPRSLCEYAVNTPCVYNIPTESVAERNVGGNKKTKQKNNNYALGGRTGGGRNVSGVDRLNNPLGSEWKLDWEQKCAESTYFIVSQWKARRCLCHKFWNLHVFFPSFFHLPYLLVISSLNCTKRKRVLP